MSNLKLLFFGFIAAANFVWAADGAGSIKNLVGNVTIERSGQKLEAQAGGQLLVGDRVVTGANSSVGITLRDNTMLSAGANSMLVLNKFAFNSTTHAGVLDASVKRGTLAVISGKIAKANPGSVRFSTPTTTLGVRGTEFIIEVREDGT